MTAAPWALTEEYDWEGNSVRWTMRGSGPPVVMCHGTPWSSYVWRATAELLSSDHTVYLWDMLGYGASDKPESDVSLRTQGLLLVALLEHWDAGPVDIVAHDYGGAVALRAHLLHGAEVSSMVLASVIALKPWGSPFFRLVGDNPAAFSNLPDNLHRAMVGAYVDSATFRPLSPQLHQALVAPWLGEEGQAAFYRQIAQGDQRYTDEMEQLYANIDVPTLILWGDADDWVPVEHAHRLHTLIRGSRLEVVEDAGHLIQEDRPQLFPELVAGWLGDQR